MEEDEGKEKLKKEEEKEEVGVLLCFYGDS